MSSSTLPLSRCSSCGASTSLVCAVCLKFHLCSRPCAAKSWPGHRASCAEFSVLAALPDEALAPLPPAAPLASTEPAAGAGEPAFAGSGFACAMCGSSNAAVCARCRLVGYCGAAHQRKDWPTHKAVCRKGEFSVVPAQTWEQRMLAEAHAAAPASLAATAARPPIPDWDLERDGAPPTKIMRAWRRAADGGHAEAQADLGYCYYNGLVVAKDFVAAADWFAKAARQGYAAAQYSLGSCFIRGNGVQENFREAAAWYAKAAAQGLAEAQIALGLCFQNGTGVAKDSKTAFEWYTKAAEQGHKDAQNNLGLCFQGGTGVAQNFKTSSEWYAKAAAQGLAEAQFSLGRCFVLGLGVTKDTALAENWLRKAAAQGHARAEEALAGLRRERAAEAGAARPRG